MTTAHISSALPDEETVDWGGLDSDQIHEIIRGVFLTLAMGYLSLPRQRPHILTTRTSTGCNNVFHKGSTPAIFHRRSFFGCDVMWA